MNVDQEACSKSKISKSCLRCYSCCALPTCPVLAALTLGFRDDIMVFFLVLCKSGGSFQVKVQIARGVYNAAAQRKLSLLARYSPAVGYTTLAGL